MAGMKASPWRFRALFADQAGQEPHAKTAASIRLLHRRPTPTIRLSLQTFGGRYGARLPRGGAFIGTAAQLTTTGGIMRRWLVLALGVAGCRAAAKDEVPQAASASESPAVAQDP